MATWRTVLSLLFLHLLAISPVLAERQCYYPGGAIATGQVPCTDDEYTNCCDPNSICLINRLCLHVDRPYSLFRDSCTDPTSEVNCTSLCKDNNSNGTSTISLRTEDPKNSYWTYCCGQVVSADKGQNATCLDGRDPFTVDYDSIIYGVAALGNVSDPSSSTPSDSTANSNSSNREVAIGAGVGVPLGVIAAAAIAWGLWERMQRRRVLKSVAAQSSAAGELQPIMKSDAYMPGGQDVRAGRLVELEHRDRPLPELQGSQAM